MADGSTTDVVSVAASQIVQSVQRSPSPFPLSSSQTAASSETPPTKKRKRIFHRELKYMMYGFGDDSSPYEETVDLTEELVVDFITEMTMRAMEVGRSGKISEKDIEFLVRKDPRKLARLEELLQMNEELKIMRKDPKKYAEMMKEKFS